MTHRKQRPEPMLVLLLVVAGCARSGDEPRAGDPGVAAAPSATSMVAPPAGTVAAEPAAPEDRVFSNAVAVPADPGHPDQFLAAPAPGEPAACGTCTCAGAACACRPLTGGRCVCTDLESLDCDCTCPGETITPLELVTGGPAMAAPEQAPGFVPARTAAGDP